MGKVNNLWLIRQALHPFLYRGKDFPNPNLGIGGDELMRSIPVGFLRMKIMDKTQYVEEREQVFVEHKFFQKGDFPQEKYVGEAIPRG